MADLHIDPATEADLPLILHLITALAEYERLADAVVASEDRLRLTLFGEPPRAEVVIARVGTAPAGFAVYFHTYSTFLARPGLYLEDVFVLPEWRRAGVGRRLLEYVAQVAVSRDCGRLEWSVLNWNTPAIRFYQAMGAEPMTDWTVYRLTGDALTRVAAADAR